MIDALKNLCYFLVSHLFLGYWLRLLKWWLDETDDIIDEKHISGPQSDFLNLCTNLNFMIQLVWLNYLFIIVSSVPLLRKVIFMIGYINHIYDLLLKCLWSVISSHNTLCKYLLI